MTEVHLHIHVGEPDERMGDVLAKLDALIHGGVSMALDLTVLRSQVSANTDAQQSAILLIQQLATEIRSSAGDQDAVDDLAAQLESQAAALAAAVVENTPSGPVTT